jgi:quinol monooxygenase YgiN
MIRVIGRLICATHAEAQAVADFLPEHLRLTRAEPGCLQFDVTGTDDPMVWRVEEQFIDRASFAAHQARTAASAWFRATQAVRRDFSIIED